MEQKFLKVDFALFNLILEEIFYWMLTGRVIFSCHCKLLGLKKKKLESSPKSKYTLFKIWEKTKVDIVTQC